MALDLNWAKWLLKKYEMTVGSSIYASIKRASRTRGHKFSVMLEGPRNLGQEQVVVILQLRSQTLSQLENME